MTETSAATDLDRYERRILAVLQADARLSTQQVAERVGLSTSACWRRIRRLEKDGVILRYAAILDPAKAGIGECVFVHISLSRHSRELTRQFASLMQERQEVLECFFMTGDADVLLRVAVPSVAAYDAFVENVLFGAPGVQRVQSHFALRQIKCDTALPIDTR